MRLWFLHALGRKGKTVTMQVFGGLGGTLPIKMPLVLLFLKTGRGCPAHLLFLKNFLADGFRHYRVRGSRAAALDCFSLRFGELYVSHADAWCSFQA